MNEIKLFNKSINVIDKNLDLNDVNINLAIPRGYIVHPDCLNNRVVNFLKTLPINYNSTFYKSWVDVVSKSRLELAINQILYYIDVYTGLIDFEIPNDGVGRINFTECKVITPITIDELETKIQGLFNSGIALSNETIHMTSSLINELSLSINIDNIKNKEVLMILYKELNILPTLNEEMVRYLVYLYTNNTLLIKNKKTISLIKLKRINISEIVNKYGIEKLSSVFLRYKDLFLAMKPGNEKTINRLKTLSKRHHKPKKEGFWSNILNGNHTIKEIFEKAESLNNFKLISLLNTIKINSVKTEYKTYIIRNGKIFTKKNNDLVKDNETLYSILYHILIERLNEKACKIKLPKNIDLALPTSEKNFCGMLPHGSKVNLFETNTVIGIHRKPEHAAGFLDLSLLSSTGAKYGWNSHFYDKEKTLVFSGDIKDDSNKKEVSEMFYAKNGFNQNFILKVNNYERFNEKIKFRVFIAQSKIEHLNKNYMVNPNDIVYSTELETDLNEMMIGMIVNNNFYFCKINTSNKNVSYYNEHTLNYFKSISETVDLNLKLMDVLKDTKFEIVDDDADIDLSILDKSSLINLLS